MRSVGRIYPVEDAAVWGSIFGDIEKQTDLIALLDKHKTAIDYLIKQEAKAREAQDDALENDIAREIAARKADYNNLLILIQEASKSRWGLIDGNPWDQDQEDFKGYGESTFINSLQLGHNLVIEDVEFDHYHPDEETEFVLMYETDDSTKSLATRYIYRVGNTNFYNDSESDTIRTIMVQNVEDSESGYDFAQALLNHYDEVDDEGKYVNRINLPIMEKYFPEGHSGKALCLRYKYKED